MSPINYNRRKNFPAAVVSKCLLPDRNRLPNLDVLRNTGIHLAERLDDFAARIVRRERNQSQFESFEIVHR